MEEDGLTLLEGWARDGLTHDQIAARMGIGRSTLYNWRRKYPVMEQALRKGREVVDYQVEAALLEKALGGDLRAQIHWLSGRRPDKWTAGADRAKGKNEEEGVTVIVDV